MNEKYHAEVCRVSNDLEARVKSLENKFEQVKVVFTTRGTPTIPKITPMK